MPHRVFRQWAFAGVRARIGKTADCATRYGGQNALRAAHPCHGKPGELRFVSSHWIVGQASRLSPFFLLLNLRQARRLSYAAPVPKWVKFIIAILLLPVCAGAGQTLWMVMSRCGGADTTLIPIAAGAACWLAIFVLLPKPMWIYVVCHELTHAVWVCMFGGSVKNFKASSGRGHAIQDKKNFLISLSPYFFPFYAVLVVLVFLAGHLIWNWKNFFVWFHLLVGAAYAFHVTLTATILKTEQSDI